MKLLLTTSRKTSLRVRQFIKEFSNLFPRELVQKSNRGKQSLEELFEKALSKYDRILIFTNKKGNPNKIIGYERNDSNEFSWCFEFKLRYVKLSYEFDTVTFVSPMKTKIQFEDFEPYLESILMSFFQPFLEKHKSIQKDESIIIQFEHTNDGFHLYPIDTDRNQLPLEIIIEEILIKDPEKNSEI